MKHCRFDDNKFPNEIYKEIELIKNKFLDMFLKINGVMKNFNS